jgi:TRAP-type transport system periplasmic protein
VRGAVTKVSLPAWAEVCDKSNANCSKQWHATVAPVLGIK